MRRPGLRKGPSPSASRAAARKDAPTTRSAGRAAPPPSDRAHRAAGQDPRRGTAGAGSDTRTAVTRRSPFAIGFLGAVGALLAIWLGEQIEAVGSSLILVVVAAFLAAGLNPVVEWLMHRGLKRSWSVVVVISGVIVALALFLLAIVPVITGQITTLTEAAPEWFDELQNNSTVQELDAEYGIIEKARDYVANGDFASTAFGGVLGFGVAVLSALLNAFLIVVLMLYFLASLPATKQAVYRLAPASRRTRVAELGDRILADIGAYVSGAFVVAVTAGLTSLVFLFIVGLGEYAVALAFVVALLDVIPMIGATLGAVVVSLIGLATDPTIGLICIVFYVVYQQLENYVIYPRVMSRSIDIPGALIVIAALVGAGLLGVIGALLAIPTAAALLLILKEVLIPRQNAR